MGSAGKPTGKGRGRGKSPSRPTGQQTGPRAGAGSRPERSRSPVSLSWGLSAVPGAPTVGKAESSSGAAAAPVSTGPKTSAPSSSKGPPSGTREQVKLTPWQLAENKNKPVREYPTLPLSGDTSFAAAQRRKTPEARRVKTNSVPHHAAAGATHRRHGGLWPTWTLMLGIHEHAEWRSWWHALTERQDPELVTKAKQGYIPWCSLPLHGFSGSIVKDPAPTLAGCVHYCINNDLHRERVLLGLLEIYTQEIGGWSSNGVMQHWHSMSFEKRHCRIRACAQRHHGVDPELGGFCAQFTPTRLKDESAQFSDDAGNIFPRPVYTMDLVPENTTKAVPASTCSCSIA